MTNQNRVCRVCGNTVKNIWKGCLLKHSVQYEECPSCGYVQTEQPFWLEQAYSEAINTSDTGIMMRNQANADIVIATLFMLGGLNWRVVDAAGGYGILVRLLRDRGIDAYWSDHYCQNLLARGFEHDKSVADIVTVFEAFEHFVEPADELDKLLEIAPNVLISTEFIPEPTPNLNDWWYYGLEHGQHIGFFREKTLKTLCDQKGKELITDGRSYHLITDKAVSRFTWRSILRYRKFMSLLAKRKLVSKTWDDHLLMREKIVGITHEHERTQS